MEDKTDQFTRALDQFLRSAYFLTRSWHEMQNAGFDINDDPDANGKSTYPFAHSFDEVVSEIQNWVDSIAVERIA